MKKEPYHPVSCEQHSEYELAIMQRRQIQLTFKENSGAVVSADFIPIDIQTRNGEEFLVVSNGKTKQDIRLDHIEKMRILE